MKAVAESHICPGNPEYTLPESAISNRPVYIHTLPEPSKNTIRHDSCPIVSNMQGRCSACRIYRSDLASFYKSFQSTSSPAAKTNYRFIKHNKLAKRLKVERQKGISLKQKLGVLKAQITAKFNKEATQIGEAESQSFVEVL